MISPATKLISLGLTSLGTSGIGAYFTPRLLVSPDSSAELIYEESDARSASNKLDKFSHSEAQIQSKVSNLIIKFRKVLQAANSKKGEKYVELQKDIQTVSENEDKLQKIYKGGQEILAKLEIQLQKLHEYEAKRLGHEAVIHSLDYSNKSLQTLGSHIYSWGESLEKIVCALDNKSECENNAKKWFESPSVSKPSSSEGGGVEDRESEKALKQIQSSREELIKKQAELRQLITKIRDTHYSGILQELFRKSYLTGFKGKIETKRAEVKKIEDEELKKKVEEGNQQVKTLNQSYEKVVDTNKRWEILKRNVSVLGNYSGRLQNYFCNLHSNNSLEECKSSEFIST